MPHVARLARRSRLLLVVGGGAALALAPASAALAHIDPEPPAVEAGAESTVAFTVEHGCEASPTVKVEIQLPEGSSGISGGEAAGFTSSVSGQVVTFEGGPLDAETPETFPVTFTAPDEAGEVPVKIIQTCEEGSIDWIEVAAEGEGEPEHPAPILTITAGAPTGEEGTDHHAEEGSSSEGDHHAEESTDTTEADHHAEEEAAGAETTSSSEPDDGGDSSSSAPWIVTGVIVLVAAGGGFYLATRNKGGGAGPDAPDAPAEA